MGVTALELGEILELASLALSTINHQPSTINHQPSALGACRGSQIGNMRLQSDCTRSDLIPPPQESGHAWLVIGTTLADSERVNNSRCSPSKHQASVISFA